MTDGMICPLNPNTEERYNSLIKDVLIIQKWDEIRKPLLKRIEQEKRGVYKRSQNPIQAVHVGSSAVQYRKVV